MTLRGCAPTCAGQPPWVKPMLIRISSHRSTSLTELRRGSCCAEKMLVDKLTRVEVMTFFVKGISEN